MKVLDLKKVSPQDFNEFRNTLTETEEDQLAFCQLDGRAVFIGRVTDEASLVNQDYCRGNTIPILRTKMPHASSGFHDSNEFRVCAAINRRRHPSISTEIKGYRLISQVVTATLEALGIKAVCRGNNIIAEDKKIGGLSTPVFGDVIMLNIHILLDFDIDNAEKALGSPKHDMREHIRGLRALNQDITLGKIREEFINSWNKVNEEALLIKPV